MPERPRVHVLRPLSPGSERAIIEPISDKSGGAGGVPFAHWHGLNPITHHPALSPDPPAERVAMWSGWIERDPGDPRPALTTWTGPGRDALITLCDRLAPALIGRNTVALLRPHASHMLSDPRSCLTFLNERKNTPFRLLLDPVAMLTGSMLADAPDHLDRIMGTLSARPEVEAIILSDARPAPDAGIEQVPLGLGVLPADLISRLAERTTETGLPLVLLGDPSAQLESLGLA